MTAVPSSPSLLDGFMGARDARLLAAATVTGRRLLMVQCTHATRSLLKRAGWHHTEMFNAYEVAVIKDRFNRLQLAPVTKGGIES
jgi:hypothetical protein